MKKNHQILFESMSDENRVRHERKELIKDADLDEEKKEQIIKTYEKQKEVIKTKQQITSDIILEIEEAINYLEGDTA